MGKDNEKGNVKCKTEKQINVKVDEPKYFCQIISLYQKIKNTNLVNVNWEYEG